MNYIEEIIEALLDTTKMGETVWVENPTSTFASETKKVFNTTTMDNSTSFQMNISLSDDLKLKLNYSNLVMRNDALADKYKIINTGESEKLKELVQLVFDNELSGKLVKVDESQVLNDIIGSIGSKKGIRNKKIRNILGGLFS
jgi:hypothetical protein